MNDEKNIKIEDDYIISGLKNKTIKLCPHCERPGELASGCNYIKCPAKDCNGEWCFYCGLKKGKGENECDNKSHNSH